jgi:hypothetical protein
MGSGHRRGRWTAKEDNMLLELLAGSASETTLTAKLKRSPEAIRMRLLLLQKKREQPKGSIAPSPELTDDTLIDRLQLPPRIKRVLLAEGLSCVGEVRAASDDTLLSFQDFGRGSLSYVRTHLGLPSREGVRPTGGK